MKRVKKIRVFLCLGLCVFLTACAGGENEEKEQDGSVQVIGTENPDASEEGDGGLAETVKQEQDNDLEEREELLWEAQEPTETLIENPSQEYYLTEAIVSQEDRSLSLELLTEEANEITDTEDWFARNELPAFDSFHMEDDTYWYEIVGDNYASGYLLNISRKEDGMFLKCLDFSDYRYTDNIKEGDWDFVEQRVWWAQSVGDVLYVAVSHNTYTESCPHTGYLTAIDLNDGHVIWKSAPCMTNGRNFEIIDDTIVCGYGFTAEPDYLNLVNRLDGSLIEQIPIKSMADYIIRKDDILYVRTYHTDYTFRIQREIGCY